MPRIVGNWRWPHGPKGSLRRRGVLGLALAAALAVAAIANAGGPSPVRAQEARAQSVVVKEGDTLAGIAVRFYGSPAAVERIASANRLADPNRIISGMTLNLPAEAGSLPAAAASTAATAASSRMSDVSGARTVMVEPGDTLSVVSERLYGSGIHAAGIAALNGITDPDRLIAGTRLTVPATPPAAAGPAASSSAGASSTRSVTVQPGDTLSAIALRLYGSADHAAGLATLNGIGDTNRIVAGMTIVAPTTPPGGAARAVSGRPLAGRRICLDPGHGGVEEPGAVYDFGNGSILREADAVLDITRTLRAWLEADGAIVAMTRAGDTFLDLDGRAALCNNFGAEITVSMHLNGGVNTSWNGALTLFFKAMDRRLAERIVAALQGGLAPSAPGPRFTAYGAQAFEGRVLLRTVMPAVIVEPVFLSYPAEALALRAPTSQPGSRRHQIVTETYRGLRMYFSER